MRALIESAHRNGPQKRRARRRGEFLKQSPCTKFLPTPRAAHSFRAWLDAPVPPQTLFGSSLLQ